MFSHQYATGQNKNQILVIIHLLSNQTQCYKQHMLLLSQINVNKFYFEPYLFSAFLRKYYITCIYIIRLGRQKKIKYWILSLFVLEHNVFIRLSMWLSLILLLKNIRLSVSIPLLNRNGKEKNPTPINNATKCTHTLSNAWLK